MYKDCGTCHESIKGIGVVEEERWRIYQTHYEHLKNCPKRQVI